MLREASGHGLPFSLGMPSQCPIFLILRRILRCAAPDYEADGSRSAGDCEEGAGYSDILSPSTACRPMAVCHVYPLSRLPGSGSLVYSLNGSSFTLHHLAAISIPESMSRLSEFRSRQIDEQSRLPAASQTRVLKRFLRPTLRRPIAAQPSSTKRTTVSTCSVWGNISTGCSVSRRYP